MRADLSDLPVRHARAKSAMDCLASRTSRVTVFTVPPRYVSLEGGKKRLGRGEGVFGFLVSEVMVISFADLVVVADHADPVDHVGEAVLELVGRTGYRRWELPENQLSESVLGVNDPPDLWCPGSAPRGVASASELGGFISPDQRQRRPGRQMCALCGLAREAAGAVRVHLHFHLHRLHRGDQCRPRQPSSPSAAFQACSVPAIGCGDRVRGPRRGLPAPRAAATPAWRPALAAARPAAPASRGGRRSRSRMRTRPASGWRLGAHGGGQGVGEVGLDPARVHLEAALGRRR